MMGTNIQPWDSKHWEAMYDETGLELVNIYREKIHEVEDSKVLKYAEIMAQRLEISKDGTEAVQNKLREIMKLFNENHKYLSAGVYLYRKNPHKYEMSLF